MKTNLFRLFALAALVCAFGFGCKRAAPPPEPFSAGELPSVLEQAFANASPEVKAVSDQVLVSVRAQDYPKAFMLVQTAAGKPGLTKEQANTLARATLTLNALLQEAQTKGNVQATRTLGNYQRDK